MSVRGQQRQLYYLRVGNAFILTSKPDLVNSKLNKNCFQSSPPVSSEHRGHIRMVELPSKNS